MQVLEDRKGWFEAFERGWLAHFYETGETDWSLYKRPKNSEIPSGRGLDLPQARLILISTAGGYLKGIQEPFDAENPLGDYTLREFLASTPLDQIAYAHTHYDHAAVTDDPEVLMPLQHLASMAHEGVIGEIAGQVISLMGYQPDSTRTLDEAIPAVIAAVKEQEADAALLVPS